MADSPVRHLSSRYRRFPLIHDIHGTPWLIRGYSKFCPIYFTSSYKFNGILCNSREIYIAYQCWPEKSIFSLKPPCGEYFDRLINGIIFYGESISLRIMNNGTQTRTKGTRLEHTTKIDWKLIPWAWSSCLRLICIYGKDISIKKKSNRILVVLYTKL